CHRNPQRVLVVGLGMGTTYRAVEAHGPELVRVVELEEAIVRAAARIGTRPREIVLDDARAYLRRTKETFDVITSDPIHPWVRGSGDLYTREYLESCRAHLAEGGVACLWVPLYQMGVSDIRDILRTFCAVFPSVALYYGGEDLVAVGGEELGPPRALEGEALRQLKALGAEDLSKLEIARRDRILAAVGEGPILTDDALRLEYSTPHEVDNHAKNDCVRWVRKLWGNPPPPYGSMLLAEAATTYDELWRHLEAARKEAPESAYVRRAVGEQHFIEADEAVREGKIERALKLFRAARGYVPNDPRLLGLEAELRAAQGNTEAAVELFERLLKLDPGSAYLKRRIAALK
ncbi:MAG: tetratricopeptide repeat protein, partial [Planctomycetota bacterium]